MFFFFVRISKLFDPFIFYTRLRIYFYGPSICRRNRPAILSEKYTKLNYRYLHTTAHTIHQKMSFQQDVNLSALKAAGGGGCSELSREGEETLKRLQITVRIIW